MGAPARTDGHLWIFASVSTLPTALCKVFLGHKPEMSPHPGLCLLCRMVPWRGLIGIKGQVLPKGRKRNETLEPETAVPGVSPQTANPALPWIRWNIPVQPWAPAQPQVPKTPPQAGNRALCPPLSPSVPPLPLEPPLPALSGSSCCSESSQHPAASAKLCWLGPCSSWAPPCPCSGTASAAALPPPLQVTILPLLTESLWCPSPSLPGGEAGTFSRGNSRIQGGSSTCWGQQVPHFLLLQEHLCYSMEPMSYSS